MRIVGKFIGYIEFIYVWIRSMGVWLLGGLGSSILPLWLSGVGGW